MNKMVQHISQIIKERWSGEGVASCDPGKAAITFRQWEKIKNRMMTVVRAPGTDDRPMFRVSNRFLIQAGFMIGRKVEVEYGEGVLTITIKN